MKFLGLKKNYNIDVLIFYIFPQKSSDLYELYLFLIFLESRLRIKVRDQISDLLDRSCKLWLYLLLYFFCVVKIRFRQYYGSIIKIGVFSSSCAIFWHIVSEFVFVNLFFGVLLLFFLDWRAKSRFVWMSIVVCS